MIYLLIDTLDWFGTWAPGNCQAGPGSRRAHEGTIRLNSHQGSQAGVKTSANLGSVSLCL